MQGEQDADHHQDNFTGRVFEILGCLIFIEEILANGSEEFEHYLEVREYLSGHQPKGRTLLLRSLQQMEYSARSFQATRVETSFGF